MDAPGATEASASRDSPGQGSPPSPLSQHKRPHRQLHADTGDHDDDEDLDHEDEDTATERGSEHDDYDDEEEDEPHLKYSYLTKQLGAVFRNGDATSTFVAAGDKMVLGTHNGNIHIFSTPLFRPLRVYHAHSATVTSISVSPFPPPLPGFKHELATRFAEGQGTSAKPSSSSGSIRGQSRGGPQAALPATPSNSIYVATSSIDGNVCIASLLDKKDVILRNFGRPVQAVALSPEYKSDRTFVSGGRAGELILTAGGKVGVSANSTTMGGAAATASSWLGTFGLGANTGKDTVLHSGEGAISTIKWSLSGKYVAWVNEEGIKIMRSHLHLDSADSELAWKRVSHTDRPNRQGWEDMASVWKARAEWADETQFESEHLPNKADEASTPTQSTIIKERLEKLIVGWGGTVWVIHVYPDRPNKSNKELKIGSVEVATILRTDCLISGISLYSPSQLAVLAYVEAERDDSNGDQSTRRRPRGQEPELRIIDIESKEELSADTLSVSRYENLTASDYHMCVLPPWKTNVPVSQRGALGALGTGLWDATMYPARLFSSAASIRSSTSNGDKVSSKAPSTFASRRLESEEALPTEVQDIAESVGPKIFVHSPYDCVVALKRDLADHFAWLTAHEKFAEAWELLEEHPEAAGILNDGDNVSITQSSIGDVFPDDRSTVTATDRGGSSTAAIQEKRRIGELWIGQLTRDDRWQEAAEVCTKSLATTPSWEHWAWTFVKKDKFDEISSVIPVELRPPLASKLYGAILEYYLAHDRQRFSELIDIWPSDLFDVSDLAASIEKLLDDQSITPETDQGQVLMRSLAKLYLADGHYTDALRCYIRIQDADTAIALVKDHHLLDALSDDIPAFVMIRVSKEQMKSAPLSELAELTAEPIKLLVSEAHTGIMPPDTVVEQLQTANKHLFLFFYLRALWRGESLSNEVEKPRRGRYRQDAASKLAADEGKNLVEQFADTAADLFAEYDRPLFLEFLQTSTAYSFDVAVNICEQHRYTSELIYLLSKMGQTKRALNLILSDLKDVSQAIAFAKSQNDPDLWEDLVDYSMDKPRFIHGLLVEAGTSIDPIKLVRRIPSGLEIEGLREGLTGLLREHDLQASISQGAAKVLQSEVAIGMNTLRSGQRRGIKFNIAEVHKQPAQQEDTKSEAGSEKTSTPTPTPTQSSPQAGRCAGCHRQFQANEKEILVAFACGHAYHLSHVHRSEPTSPAQTPGLESGAQTPRGFPPSSFDPTLEEPSTMSRTVGPKVTTARLLRDRVGEGCRICALAKELEAIGDET